MRSETHSHVKLLKLSRALDVPHCYAVGVLECLWEFTRRHAPQGNIGRWTDEEIALGTGWPRDPGEFVQALVSCGWLDEHPEHRLVVHEWSEHCDLDIHCLLEHEGLTFADGTAPRFEERH